MTAREIPSFGYKPEDFKKVPFVFEMSRLGTPSAGPRRFAHRHSYFHLLWLTGGAGVHVIDFEGFALSPPSVFFVAPHQVHFWTSDTTPSGYSIKFNAAFMQRIAESSEAFKQLPFGASDRAPVVYLGAEPARQLVPQLEAVLVESLLEHRWREAMLLAQMQTLLIALIRLDSVKVTSEVPSRHAAIARKFSELVEAHFTTTRKTDDYAQMLEISTGALNDTLRRTRGRTASQLITERLTLEAKRRLIFSGAPVGDVGVELGFDDPAYFARFFRKNAGMTPAEFRRTHEVRG